MSTPTPDEPGRSTPADPATRAMPRQVDPATDRATDRTSDRTSDRSGADWPTTAGGETYVAGSGTADEPRTRRRGGSHLSGLVLCLLLTPVALGLLDYSVSNGWPQAAGLPDTDTVPPTEAWVTMAIAAGVLLVVALLARASGPAALLAGLVWGAAPAVALVLRPSTFADVVRDLPDPYDGFGDGLLASTAVFPVLGALLVGIGLAGRWRARRTVETTA